MKQNNEMFGGKKLGLEEKRLQMEVQRMNSQAELNALDLVAKMAAATSNLLDLYNKLKDAGKNN